MTRVSLVEGGGRHHSVAEDGFAVPLWLDALGGLAASYPGLWRRLGDLETRLLGAALEDVRIEYPIYITGLARSGTTVLLELMARHPHVATHRYQDHPFLHVPYAWNAFLERAPRSSSSPVERPHGDGIRITPQSPESFEEALWMHFFPGVHESRGSDVLDARHANPEFDRFYRDHLRKLLLVRGARRYAAKANYNITRMAYLRHVFPDARFVVPVREPVSHVASMMRQHERFSSGERRHPRALRYLRRVGHFEFGLGRRAINAGDDQEIAAIDRLWRRGDEAAGWARYWCHVYGHVAACLQRDPDLRRSTLVLRYEDLCRTPGETMQAVLEHCRLDASSELLQAASARCKLPAGYGSRLTLRETAAVREHTRELAAYYGYDNDAAARSVDGP